MPAKFLVCTMYSGEPDYERCVESILTQEYVTVKHVVIENMPEIDAHNALYNHFNSFEEGWIRAKIDADVVLDPGALVRIAHKFDTTPSVTWIDPWVDDYLTDTKIKAGVAFYASSVKFSEQKHTLKCDRGILPRGTLSAEFDCIGKHMHFCDERTAFRYGLHRGLKGQPAIHSAVAAAHKRHKDRVRKMALKGFEAANFLEFQDYLHGRVQLPPQSFNYNDERFKQLFEQARLELDEKIDNEP